VNSASLWLLRSQSPKAIYMPLIQEPGFDQPMITIKVRPGATGIAQAARSLLERFGYHYPLRIQSLEERSEMYLSQERVLAMLSTIFGGLALLLASIGIYGLLSFAVSRRSSEIGVRMALGARPHEIQRMVLLEASLTMLVGLAGGIPLGLAGPRMISGMLFGIAPFDPATVVVSATLLLSVGLFAGYLPARRASHTDPMRALQSE
jgi:ABC-type antimicrobial peptide transport system permease subunit